MGIKDQELLEYLRDTKRCADLINGTLFKGRQIVQPEYLRKVSRKKTIFPDSTNQQRDYIQKRNSSDVTTDYMERERDIILLHDKPGQCFYIACEGESQPNYRMPVRSLTYDAVEYSQQIRLSQNKGVRREGVTKPLTPVFHEVLYLGEKRWLSKYTLREMMDIPLNLSEYVTLLPDYEIHLVDIHEQNPELFQTEWKDIFCFMSHSRKKGQLKKYVEEQKEKLRSLSMETRRFLAALLDQYEILDNGHVEVRDVCDAWDGAMLMYKEEGIKALIQDNVEEGKGKEIILRKLERRFSLSEGDAELYYTLFAEDEIS